MKEIKDFHLLDPTWCRGCGLFSIFSGLKKVSASLQLEPEQMVIVTGIGCHGRLNNYFNAYGFHTLHGRALPVAAGAKISNPELSVIVVSGDGDTYSIGLGHFIHAVRRNIDLVHIVVDNRLYALTKGQTSPTSDWGYVSSSTPEGSKVMPLNGPELALVSGGTFIARGFAGNPKHLASLLQKAIEHKGFSLVEVLSPCVTHNKLITYEWFKKHIYYLDEEPGYNPRHKKEAGAILSRRDKIPVGLFYKEKRDPFEDLVLPSKKPLVSTDLHVDVSKMKEIIKEYE
jgi:2-oxoglutarate ferredoxin oxidoreductase subunit beta